MWIFSASRDFFSVPIYYFLLYNILIFWEMFGSHESKTGTQGSQSQLRVLKGQSI